MSTRTAAVPRGPLTSSTYAAVRWGYSASARTIARCASRVLPRSTSRPRWPAWPDQEALREGAGLARPSPYYARMVSEVPREHFTEADLADFRRRLHESL